MTSPQPQAPLAYPELNLLKEENDAVCVHIYLLAIKQSSPGLERED